LELEISATNAQDADEPAAIRREHIASPAILTERVEASSLDALLYMPRPVSGVPWYQEALHLATHALRPGARWYVAGRSADLAAPAKHHHPFVPEESKKLRGHRVLVLRR